MYLQVQEDRWKKKNKLITTGPEMKGQSAAAPPLPKKIFPPEKPTEGFTDLL